MTKKSQNCPVLIVEDDETIRETIRVALELAGYDAVTAADGLSALEQLKQISAPCLILLDLMMPQMDGFELEEALCKNPETASIPVIAVTAFPEKAKLLKHARGVIAKPFDLDKLMTTVSLYCG